MSKRSQLSRASPELVLSTISFSRKQNLHYKIYLVNQTDLNPFNRAMLFNVGFTEAMNDHNWNCVIFHDVDLIPEDDRNIYRSPQLYP